MKPQELRECLRRLGMTKHQLGALLDTDLAVIDLDTARRIRALVLRPDVRDVVSRVRICFSDATFAAIRTITDE